MSFMTILVFSWILCVTTFCIYNEYNSLLYFHNDYDLLYTIEEKHQVKLEKNQDSLTIIAYIIIIVTIILPQIPKLDL